MANGFQFPIVLLLFCVALAIEGASVGTPDVWLVVAALLGIFLVTLVVTTWHQQALMCSFFLLLLASTKFRTRDPNALLAGSIDTQIAFELALYGLVLFIVVLNISVRPLHEFRLTPWNGALILYVILALVSAAWSYDFRLTVVRGVQLSILCAVSFTTVHLFGSQRVIRLLTTSVVLYVLLFALLTVFFPETKSKPLTHGLGWSGRFTWLAVHPITAATCAASAAILALAEGFFAPGGWRRRILRLPLWLYTAPLVLILLATHSRGPLFAFLAAASGLWMSKRVNPWLAGTAAALVTLLFVSVLGSSLPLSEISERALNEESTVGAYVLRGQSTEDFRSMTGRIGLWQSAYEQFLERPLFGYGYVSSRNFLLDVRAWAGDAHNALIESLLNLGLVGTALVWGILASAILASSFDTLLAPRRPSWPHAAVFGSLVFILMNSLTNASFVGPPGYDALLFFFALFTHERLRMEKSREEKDIIDVASIFQQERAAV